MSDTISIAIKNSIATVALNRAEKKNAMSIEMMEDLIECGETLKEEPDVRAIILTGEGDSFCAGIDLSDLMKFAGNLDKARELMATPLGDHGANIFQRPATVWRELPVPVIAAIKGNCLGAGAQLCLGADFRIAAPDTCYSIMEAKWGLIPDMGISQSLPKLLPADRAMELIMTGRVLSAEEALRFGLFTEISKDPLARAEELAETLMLSTPEALAASKQMVHQLWYNPKEGLQLEAHLQSRLIGSPNQMEKTMASMQKRDPIFK